MNSRRALPATALLLAAATLWWWTGTTSTPPPGGPLAAGASPTALSPNEPSTPPSDGGGDGVMLSRQRQPAVPEGEATPADAPLLPVILIGVRADAPWTTPLRCEVSDRSGAPTPEHNGEATVDADGHADFRLPAWAGDGRAIRLRLFGQDPGYRPVSYRRKGAFDVREPIRLDVEAIVGVRGTVRDRRGDPVATARVSAFALRDGNPRGEALASASTGADGAFGLDAPPDVSLLLVATPMQAQRGRMRAWGDVADNGEARLDLLPDSRVVTLLVGAPPTNVDFVLDDSAQVNGVVRFPDGGAVCGARVSASVSGDELPLSDAAALQRDQDGVLHLVARVTTDESGCFTLPGRPGSMLKVQLQSLPDVAVVGDLPSRRAIPPATIELTVPRPVRLRTIDADGSPAAARIAIAGDAATQTREPIGELQLLAMCRARVRAEAGPALSEWCDVPPAATGTVVVLELERRLTPLSIEFDGQYRVRNASFRWSSDDGRGGVEVRLRDDRGGPFAIWLEPGRYSLCAEAAGGERNGYYLLPTTRELVVSSEPVDLRLPARFGGRFVLEVRGVGSDGVSGTFRVLGALGNEPVPIDGSRASPPSDVLPPGDYELLVDLPPRAPMRQAFALRERELTAVIVRLP